MFEWIGSLRVRECSPMRVVLSLSRTTWVVGWLLVAAGAYLGFVVWPIAPFLTVLPGAIVVIGALLATMHRELVFDREAGILRMEQRAFGMKSRAVVPLFHLRAVVIEARSLDSAPLSLLSPSRYVAYVDRRVGDTIYLDESRRCAKLMIMAEAIAEVAELRLEYDAMSHAGE